MQKVTIDPSIAIVVDIASVGHEEDENIYFKADSDWIGAYVCKIWNSDKKNTLQPVSNNLSVIGKIMTFRIAPSVQNLEPKAHYYEIWSTTEKRIIFKGLLNIVK